MSEDNSNNNNNKTEDDTTIGNERVGECAVALVEWAIANGYDDVILPACAAAISSIPKGKDLDPSYEYLMCFVSQDQYGPKLITVDGDLGPFLDVCIANGVDDIDMHEYIFLPKRLDTEEDLDDTNDLDGLKKTPSLH